MSLLNSFKMPKPVTIIGRSSSITNSFVNGIIPVIPPTEAEVAEALNILGLDAENLECAYCGDRYTEWDHLRPLIRNRKPTGYISEIGNLVPACGKCNQSKGNKNWRTWIISDAKLSPKTKGINDLNERIRRLEAFEQWRTVEPLDFESIVGSDKWQQYERSLAMVIEAMRSAQNISNEIKTIIANNYKNER